MSIKYYHLAKDEEPPEEFCAVRDVGGEPSEYVFYVPGRENVKLRELATGLYKCWVNEGCEGCPMQDDDGWCVRDIRLRELGVEVDG